MKLIDIYREMGYTCAEPYFRNCVRRFGIDGAKEYLEKYTKTKEKHYSDLIENIKKYKGKRMSRAILSQIVSVLYGFEIGKPRINKIIERMTKENVVSTIHGHYRIE